MIVYGINPVLEALKVGRVTAVPLASPEIAGLLNLRGRVVTALDLRNRLGLPPGSGAAGDRMAIGLEAGSDLFGLLVDSVGDVVTASPSGLLPVPAHLDPAWACLTRAIHPTDGRLLMVLDVDAVLSPGPAAGRSPLAPAEGPLP